jgi:hypothetical protein
MCKKQLLVPNDRSEKKLMKWGGVTILLWCSQGAGSACEGIERGGRKQQGGWVASGGEVKSCLAAGDPLGGIFVFGGDALRSYSILGLNEYGRQTTTQLQLPLVQPKPSFHLLST